MYSKYNVDHTVVGKAQRTYDGVVYDSKLEMAAYRDWIEPMLRSGEITKVERQVKYELQPAFTSNDEKYRPILYKSDFDLYYPDGTKWVVDIKGMVKPIDRLHEKMLRYRYPGIHFDFIGYSKIDGGWVSVDTITRGRKERKKAKLK